MSKGSLVLWNPVGQLLLSCVDWSLGGCRLVPLGEYLFYVTLPALVSIGFNNQLIETMKRFLRQLCQPTSNIDITHPAPTACQHPAPRYHH